MASKPGVLMALAVAAWSLCPQQASHGEGRPGGVSGEALPGVDVLRPDVHSPGAHSLSRTGGGPWALARSSDQVSFLAWGSGIALSAGATDPALESAARGFVDDHPVVFRVSSTDLHDALVRRRGKLTSVSFRQHHEGVPVLGASVRIVVDDSGAVVAAAGTAVPLRGTVPPTMSRAEAARSAEATHGAGKALEKDSRKWILPDTNAPAGLRVIWRVPVASPSEPMVILTIDAQSGELLAEQQLSYDVDVAGAVTGPVDFENPCDATVATPFADLAVEAVGAGTVYTDAAGSFAVPGVPEPATIQARMEGRRVDVENVAGTDAFVQTTANAQGLAALAWTDANSIRSERNAYVHATRMWDWLASLDAPLASTAFPGPLWIRVEDDETYPSSANASYRVVPDGQGGIVEQLVFAPASPASWGGMAVSLGELGDVVFHEYAHGITVHVYGGPLEPQPNLSLHEGNSDVAALLLGGDPEMALGWEQGNCSSFLRTADNNLAFPADYHVWAEASPHQNGRILSGFFWDLYTDVIANGKTAAEARDLVGQIWHDARVLGQPASFVEQVFWTYVVADDDGDLSNGVDPELQGSLDLAALAHGFAPLGTLAPNVGQFEEITTAAAGVTDAQALAWSDFDNDGDEDLYIARNPGRLLRNDGSGLLVDATPASLAIAGIHAAWGDYDNDGYQDLYVCRGAGGSLFRGTADGTFPDVTSSAFPAGTGTGLNAEWLDFDGDGWLDLHSGELFLQSGGTFVSAGAAGPPYLGLASWSDFDRDGDWDYCGSSVAQTAVYRNDAGTFVDVTPPEIQAVHWNRAIVWRDYNADGFPDLLVTNRLGTTQAWGAPDGTSVLLESNQGASFSAVGSSAVEGSQGDAAAFGDYDNDADLDLYFGRATTNAIFRNDGVSEFQDVTVGPLAEPANTIGVAWADIDLDGDIDLAIASQPSLEYVVGNGTQYGDVPGLTRIFRNDQSEGNAWLGVRLVGTESNRDAIGAVVRCEAGGVVQEQDVAGRADSRRLHFGLGAAALVDRLTIAWPSGRWSSLFDVPVESFQTVTEPTGNAPTPQISGPTQLYVNVSGTWTASAVGGSTPYTFLWYRRPDCFGPWNPVGTGPTYTGSGQAAFCLKVEVVGGDGLTASVSSHVAIRERPDFQMTSSRADRSEVMGIAPNPFRGRTAIQLALRDGGPTQVHVYDAAGRRVRTLVDEVLAPGKYDVKFEAAGLPAGVYFYRVESRGLSASGRAILLR